MPGDEVPTTQPETPEPHQDTPSGKPSMSVKVYAPFKIYFEGQAQSVSAVNGTGPFDVLPKHHNFLCMLVPCTLTVVTEEGRKDIKISRALMHVKSDRVDVFVDV